MIRYLLRGGSYMYVTMSLRTSDRVWSQPEFGVGFSGFRLVIRRVG